MMALPRIEAAAALMAAMPRHGPDALSNGPSAYHFALSRCSNVFYRKQMMFRRCIDAWPFISFADNVGASADARGRAGDISCLSRFQPPLIARGIV